MNDKSREKHMKVLADYQKLLDEWPLKPSIEERMAAFKQAQEMVPRVRLAQDILSADRFRQTAPTEEEVTKHFEEFCDFIGINSSELLKHFKRNTL
jgi:hypothetical protein